MRIRTSMFAFAAALALSAGIAEAKPMTDAEFEKWSKQFEQQRDALSEKGADRAAFAELYNTMLDRLDFADLRPSQVMWLANVRAVNYTGLHETGRDYTDEAKAVAAKHLDDKSAEGAVAAALHAQFSMTADTSVEEDTAFVRAALTHPGVDEALKQGKLANFNGMLAYGIHPDVRTAVKDEYVAYLEKLPRASTEMVEYSDALYERAATLEGVDKARLEKIRIGLIKLADRASEASGDAERYAGLKKTLEMAPKIASLVGNPAPEIDFIWTSADGAFQRLADLRGKVVVLDFWATWCGPCVASFPNVRKLVEHYDGYPVEVIGVTSIQGSTIFRDERGRVTAETPEAEFAQMKEYIADQDLTWTVAFSEEDVFNPEYGVRGIPHLVIIDPEGVLRHRAMHPASPLSEKTSKIDAILKEFNLPTPAPVAEEGEEN